MMANARKYTEDEVRTEFLRHIWFLVHYWRDVSRERLMRGDEISQRLEGLAFSILVQLDGGADLPGFIVAPCPHPDDKAYHKSRGENWYPENHEANVTCDIGGYLHEMFYEEKP
jgi:hypothetical protein